MSKNIKSKERSGWALTKNARKYHYFLAGANTSLCKKQRAGKNITTKVYPTNKDAWLSSEAFCLRCKVKLVHLRKL